MKVWLSVDMEGISGLVRWADVISTGMDFQRNRRFMTQDANAAIRQAPGYNLHLLAAFHNAGAGHDDRLLAAYGDVSDLDLRSFRFEGARGQFVRRADESHLVDAFEQFQFPRIGDPRAHRAEQRVA